MKKFLYTILAAVALLTVVSCEGFLSTNPTSSVSDQSVFTSPQGAQAALSGCYNLLFFGYGAGRPDTQGYMSHMLSNDTCGDDIIVDGGWYTFDYNHWGHQRGDIFKAGALWGYYYELINNLNSVITYTPTIEGGIQSTKDHILGQAYAMRGWAYFQLAQTFQHTYALSAPRDMPGVPLYTEPSSDKTEGKARASIKDVYAQILSDLGEAETLLNGFVRTQKNHFDLTVVQGLLSRVYLEMNNWAEAEKYASLVLAKYPLTTTAQWNSGFNDAATSSWIWAMLVDAEHNLENNGDYGPFAFWTNYITRNGGDLWSFNCFFLNDKFVALFDADDIRAQQFHLVASKGYYMSDKFYDTPDLTGDFVFMRADEMLLNKAEALARQGKDTDARDCLNQLRELRNATPSLKSGNALLDDIYQERRKELYGEGFAWYDLRREQRPLLREGKHKEFSGDKPIPANSWRFVYQIPTSEILNNPNINSDIWPAGDQNPFGEPSLVLN